MVDIKEEIEMEPDMFLEEDCALEDMSLNNLEEEIKKWQKIEVDKQ